MAQHFEVHSMDILDVSLNGQHHYDHHHMSSWMPQQVHPMQGIPTSQGPHHIEIYAPVYQPDIQSLNHVYYHEPIELTAPHQGIQSEHLEPMEEARYGSPNKSYSPPTENEESMEMDETNKNHSTPMTLKWLNDNYEIAEGVCIPRNTLYQHYRDFCEKHEFTAVNAASFGKIIRQTFPQVTTRRLGTRGQSKYHYYGIGVKEKSPYYDFVYSKAGLQSGIANKKETPKQTPVASYTPKSKMGTLLPEFPGIEDLKLPDDIPQDKLQTFIVMYRTHCQRILDTVIRANFDEVQSFLLHFWQGMPSHMTSILGAAPIVGMVAVCDTILYKAVCNVLMPHVLQALPESLMTVIKTFAKQLEEWIEAALNNLPEPLKDMKLEMSRNFSKILRLQMSLNHLCQASRSVVSSNDIMTQMLEDWQTIDRLMIIKQTRFTLNQLDMYSELDIINKFYDEFETLLTEQCQLESLIDWLDRLIDESVVKASDVAQKGSIKAKSQKFLLVWSAYGTRIVRDMTLHSAPSFGSFHLLSLMFDEYILYHLEQLCCDEAADEVMAEIKGTAKISFMSKLREKTVEVTSPVSFYSNESSNDVLPLATPVEASTSHMELLRTFTESHPTVATIDMSMMNPHNSSPSHNGRNNTSPLQQPHMQQQQFSQEHHQHQHQQPLRSHTQHHGHGTPHPLERPLELDQLDMRPQQAHTQQPTDTSYFSLHDCGGQSIEDTWRMSDAIPPPPNLSYHGSLYHTNNISPPTSQLADTSNILNYAVNSLNLPLDQPDHSMQDLTSEIRVTYDPVEAQASLTRSFQPFSDQFFGHSSSS